jgi:hypothetical protein
MYGPLRHYHPFIFCVFSYLLIWHHIEMNLGRCKGWCSKETIWYSLQPSVSCCQWKLVWCMGIREAHVGKACLPQGAGHLGRADSLYTFRWSTSLWGYSKIYQYMPRVRYINSQFFCTRSYIQFLLLTFVF